MVRADNNERKSQGTRDKGLFPALSITCISGLVVKSNVAIVGPRVRFPADAKFCPFVGKIHGYADML